MSWYMTEQNESHMNTTINKPAIDFLSKPIIIYNFIDLTCSHCWSLEPYLKKLILEYGMYFTIRPVVSHTQNPVKQISERLTTYGLDCKQDVNDKVNPLISVKAAALQGNKASRCFLRKVQEAHFLYAENIYNRAVIMDCATKADLDLHEFKADLQSLSARKAFQCDKKIKTEMDVKQLPTLVFFSQVVEDHTVKVSGIQSYDTYVYILKEMLQKELVPAEKPSLETFLHYHKVAHLNELAIIYDSTIEEMTLRLKQLQLMQKVALCKRYNRVIWTDK